LLPRIPASLTEGQEEEVSRLVDTGSSTSVSAEQAQAQANAYWSTTVWMQFDAREGPNQPVLLDVSFALYPPSYPTSDFPPVLLRFLRWGNFATAGNRHDRLINGAKDGSYLKSFITYVQAMAKNGLFFASTTQTFLMEGFLAS
jgi:hypothetical protein